MSKLSFILKEKRLSQNLSLREAAKKIGISHGYLDKLEKGIDQRTGTSNKPTPETLQMISKAYDINYNYLLELCGYIQATACASLVSPQLEQLISIGKILSPLQINHLTLYAKFMFPDAFKDK